MGGCQRLSWCPPSSSWTVSLIIFFLLGAASWQCSYSQSHSQYSYNCSHSHSLRASDATIPPATASEGRSCQETCILCTPALPVATQGNCTTLTAILGLYQDTVPPDDCLELVFAPGHYMMSSLLQARVRVEYSLVLVAPEGGVTLACASSADPRDACGAEGGGSPMMAFQGNQPGNMFVIMDGIHFRYCSRQQFDELERLSVTNCEFLGFSSSALDLLNVQNIVIHNTSFRDCVSGNGSEQFRANSGAVSIAYYRAEEEGTANSTELTLSIDGCTFINNSAFLLETNSDQLNRALNTNFFNARGGALGIIPQGFYANVRGEIKNTTFLQNRADLFGGSVVLFISGNENSHEFRFDDCRFIGNSAGAGGGGILTVFQLRNLISGPTKITITGSRFEDNSAYFGGGMGIVQVYSQGHGNLVAVENTQFVGNRALNVGAAVAFQTFAYVQSRLAAHFYSFTDCSFSDNVAPGGILGAGFGSMNLFGTILFTNNTGPALRLVGGLIVVNGTLSFLSNKVVSSEGGALYIQEFGQVKLMSGSEIEFINNTGRIGSAVVVDVQRSSLVFSELVYNPQCFLIHENSTLPPSDWDDVSIRFSGNTANIGPVVYISHLLHCSWYALGQVDNVTNEQNITFDVQSFSQWAAFEYNRSNMAMSHSDVDALDPTFYFQTEPVNITSTNSTRKIRPGQIVPLKFIGKDQFDNPTYIIARVSDARANVNLGAFSQAVSSSLRDDISNLDIIRFEPALLPVQPNVGVANISYVFTNEVDPSDLGEDGMVVPIVIDTPFNIIGSVPLRFNVSLSSCLPGYQLSRVNNLFTCRCTDSDFYILNCEEDVIVLRDGMWAGMEVEPYPHLDLTVCPTSFCRCHTRSGQQVCESLYYQDNSESGQQCHPTRNGTLCGRCVNDTSVGVLRSNCRECVSNTLYALGFLVIGDALLISFIVFAIIGLKLHFPHSLKGLLFYIQTVYYATEHFPIGFWDVRKYMLYISSAIGLYFPFDFCLYPAMSSLTAFGLKFIPAAVALVIAVIATLGVYLLRARNGRKRVWRAVWFLILLLYAPLFHNCVALLKCPLIPDATGGEEERRWFYDGEVVCFQDPGHIVLSMVAIIVLAILVLLSPALLVFTSIVNLKRIKNKSLTVDWIMSALTEGYRDSWEAVWWTSWELFRRYLLIAIVVSLPGRSLASAYVVTAAFAMHIFFEPYRKLFQNAIEIVVLLNYTILLLVRSTQTFLDNISSRYTGTAVPDSDGAGLPDGDSVIWLFVPFFYSPLLFAAIFSLGALIYRIIKSSVERRKKSELDINVSEVFSGSVYYVNHATEVTTTELSGPSL